MKEFLEWVNQGHTVLPNLLIRYYKVLSLTNEELIILLQLKSYQDSGNYFPDLSEIAQNLQVANETIYQTIQSLIEKKCLSIQTKADEEGKKNDYYSLDQLWEKLIVMKKQDRKEDNRNQKRVERGQLYQSFEQEFGRSLSPIEIEMISQWLDEDLYSVELINMALREAVLNQAYSLKYMDRILLNWENKNIRTLEQAERESDRFRDKFRRTEPDQIDTSDENDVPLYRWIDDD